MSLVEHNDPLAAHREGVTVRGAGRAHGLEPCPLEATAIDVTIVGGFATVETKRTFRNIETVPIEATLTFPVPIDAVMHGLVVEIDGRTLRAVPKAREIARTTYEDAIDLGKLAVLHEEVLRGVHMVSVGQLAPGATCAVISTWSTITIAAGGSRRLRIPTTVGEIYGRLPLNPADDLLPGAAAITAHLKVRAEGGIATVIGETLRANGATLEGEVDIGHAIDIVLTGASLEPIEGHSAAGRVMLDIGTAPVGDRRLDLAILFDRSSSTEQHVRSDGTATVWSAMRDALSAMLRTLRASDRVTLYEFHTTPALVGRADGPEAARLVEALNGPTGGTEIGLALDMALSAGAADIFLLTDGRSGALDVHRLAGAGARISALLVGPDSLEATVGHLAALTGGQIVCASGLDAADHLVGLSTALRTTPAAVVSGDSTCLPDCVSGIRGASRITARWSKGQIGPVDAVGAFAAALALPSMARDAATACAIAHGLCTHLTSLVVVDEAGSVQDAIPETRKVPLPRPRSSQAGYAMPAPAMSASMPSACMPSASMPAPFTAPPPAAAPFDGDIPAFLRREGAGVKPGAPSAPRPPHRSFLARMFAPRRPEHEDARDPTFEAKSAALKVVGLGIDWSRHADRLANGNLEDLDPLVQQTILSAAQTPQVVAAAAKVATRGAAAGPIAIAIAAALAALAARSEDRSAARLVRHVTARIGEGEMLRLATGFGLLAVAA